MTSAFSSQAANTLARTFCASAFKSSLKNMLSSPCYWMVGRIGRFAVTRRASADYADTNPPHTTRYAISAPGQASAPIPKFASPRGTSDANFGIKRGTSNFMIPVRFEFEVPTRACRANNRNFKFTALERFPIRLTNLARHGRARPGHPRLVCGTIDVDARNKSGHDGGGFGSTIS